MQPASPGNHDSGALGRALSAAKWLTLFLLFVAAYGLPLILDNANTLQLTDSRIRQLLSDVLATPAVRMEIFRNTGSHLLLLVPAFVILSAISRQISVTAKIASWAAHLVALVAGWIFLTAGNAVMFPTSDYSVPFSALAHPAIAIGIGTLLCYGLALAVCRLGVAHRRLVVVISLGLAALFAGSIGVLAASRVSSASHRNVILIGVDSLSASAFNKLQPSLPHLSRLLNSGRNYQRAYTPLGRTFPAWVSILSGKQPVEHGAIFNLRNMDYVDRRGLISSDLQAQGYRTIYAIDERRFNNIDQSFGFDYAIGPSAGALDFLLQRMNDTPLSNLLLQTRLGKSLMPFSYINTASHTNYDAIGFVDSVLNRSSGTTPLFLAVHFESAHFPFKTRHSKQRFRSDNQFWNAHAAALTVVDQQVGQLMAGLGRQGLLEDALVVVFSDHGEGLGLLEATLQLDGKATPIRVYGHGADVLSDHANRIILGVAAYKGGRPDGPSTDDQQVSLLDLKSLIERYAASGDTALLPTSPCMVVETGLRLPGTDDYRTLDEANLAAHSAGYYEIDTAGRMRLREDQLRELAATKDVGIRCRDHLTYLSVPRNNYYSIALDGTGLPTSQISPISADIAQIEAYRLRMQQALSAAAHYAVPSARHAGLAVQP
jgi:hypothetical protein